MSKVLEHIQYLADEIGTRGSTSDEEKNAAEYIVTYLRSLGDNVRVSTQIFKSPNTWTWTNALTLLLVLIAVAIYPYSSIIATILTGLVVIFFITENETKPTLSRLAVKHESQNVIGKIKSQQTTRKTVVLTAHMDSSGADYVHHPNRVAGFRKIVIMNLILFVIIFAIFTTGTFFDLISDPLNLNGLEWIVTLLLAIPVLYSLIILILREVHYDLVPGANDNASGVGIVLEMMNKFSKIPLQNTDVIAVLTGCEEVGCNGMIEYLKEFGEDKKNTHYINLDNCGEGTPIFTPVEGIFYPHKADPDLLRLARKVQKDNPGLEVVEKQFRAGYTDGTAAMVRGDIKYCHS